MCSELRNAIPLSGAAHTRAFYARLPHGWRTSPEDVWTDLHMWRQILAVPDVRVAFGEHPTVLVFPTPHRGGVDGATRGAEIEAYVPRLLDDTHRRDVERALCRSALLLAGQKEATRAVWHRTSEEARIGLDAALTDLRAAMAEQARVAEDRVTALQVELDASRRTLAATNEALAGARRSIDKLRGSAAFKLRHRLLRTPGLRGPLLAVGRVVSRVLR
jgi:hypothetical protein